jgi:hypothetical protein
LALFDDGGEKSRRLEAAADAVRDKFGEGSLRRGLPETD